MFETVFLKDGRLRPVIRLFYSVVGILTVGATVEFVAIAMPAPTEWLPRGLTFLFWFRVLLLPVLLGLYALLTRLLEQRPLGSVGFAFHPRWKNELVMGLIAGTVMILAVAGIEGLLGAAKFSPSPVSMGRVILAGGFFFLLLTVAAADEELIFRGYPFQRLVETVGSFSAVILASMLFGFAHFGNPFHTWISTLNTVAVGVLLAICYLRTRALWLPFGIHFAWNFVQGFVLGLPVSGLAFPDAIVQAKVNGPRWLTGSAYGPEGSILTLGIILAGTVYFFASGRIFPTREMLDLALGPGGGNENEKELLGRGTASDERL